MVDIHSHILYGIDDGSPDRETSLAMLKIAAETGTTDIVATPHSDDRFRYDRVEVERQIAELNEATGNRPFIHRGCDFHLSIDNVQACLADHRQFTINGRGYLMLEFADTIIPPSTESVLRQLLERGAVPVVTHPERNPILRQSTERLRDWMDQGILVQVTAQSLTDRFGASAQNAAWNWLRKGMVHVLASDAHDTRHRPPRLDLAHELVSGKMGTDAADLLLLHNPQAILEGRPVMALSDAGGAASDKKWYQFWR